MESLMESREVTTTTVGSVNWMPEDAATLEQPPPPPPPAPKSAGRVVLIAVDGGDECKRAFDFFMRRLYRRGDHVTFAHVGSPPSGLWSDPNEVWHSLVASARQLERSVTGDWCLPYNLSDARWLSEICSGPGPAIVKMAEDRGADLVVMGSRGLGTVRRTIMGSVSEYVMHHTSVPVVVVPNGVQL